MRIELPRLLVDLGQLILEEFVSGIERDDSDAPFAGRRPALRR
jgi:hypothetical protein